MMHKSYRVLLLFSTYLSKPMPFAGEENSTIMQNIFLRCDEGRGKNGFLMTAADQ